MSNENINTNETPIIDEEDREIAALLVKWRERGLSVGKIAGRLYSAGACIMLIEGAEQIGGSESREVLADATLHILNHLPARSYAKLLCEPLEVDTDAGLAALNDGVAQERRRGRPRERQGVARGARARSRASSSVTTMRRDS